MKKKPDIVKSKDAKVCETGMCPISTPLGFILYSVGLLMGIFADYPYKTIGFLLFMLSITHQHILGFLKKK
ncbi:MAG: hypothetical protein KKD39_06065 [Candidatus Altiarchaeota archaeon]|nr:hypothetical protein [Candidatus Altiarchaeota archaeon]